MIKYIKIIFILAILTGCYNPPSDKQINKDIAKIKQEIKTETQQLKQYRGGLIFNLIKTRIEILKNTMSMLEQKKLSWKRYIVINYTIDSKPYVLPKNKKELLNKLEKELQNLNKKLQLLKDNIKNSGGLIKILKLTQMATLKNTITFLEQKILLLKYDIPYLILSKKDLEVDFKKSNSNDLDNI